MLPNSTGFKAINLKTSGTGTGLIASFIRDNIDPSLNATLDQSRGVALVNTTNNDNSTYTKTFYSANNGSNLPYVSISYYTAVTGVSVSPTSATLSVGGTKQLTATVSPSNATNKAVIWTSSSNSVATVNADGLVTAVGEGEAVITVTTVDGNKTAICSIVVNPPNEQELIVKNIRILYDSSVTLSTTELTSSFYNAVSAFETEYNIRFDLQYTSPSTLLNGASCPNTAITGLCNSLCGDLIDCKDEHHKGDSRLLNIDTSTTDYICRFVGHKLCYYDTDDSRHEEIYGLAYVNNLDSIVSQQSIDYIRTIQHELTHNLGGRHDDCTEGQSCVLKNDMNMWCDNCSNAILENVSEG